MEERNLDYLIRQIEFAGLEGVDVKELEKQMQAGLQEFTLELNKKIGNDDVKASLNLELSDRGRYFFNSYDLTLKRPGEGDVSSYKFRIQNGNSYTLTEAYNLLSGRSVHKSILKRDRLNPGRNVLQSGWSYLEYRNPQVDKSQILRREFDYSLKAVDEQLQKIGIKDAAERVKVMDGLSRGNQVEVMLPSPGKDEKRVLEASARFKDVTVYDENMNVMQRNLGANRKQGISEGTAETEQKEHKQDLKTDKSKSLKNSTTNQKSTVGKSSKKHSIRH